LAYAVTVHKSQGSEFSTVIIPMSWFPPALATRNLIYTAVTRGKRQVIIVGRGDYFNAMVDNSEIGRRNTGLGSRIKALYNGVMGI
jgi:exodeoxyribonuclease V alpha subunit